ncbi:hypothetical protein GUITHDRAFT_107698 [Guillardia theta CCMP2712]|uniref:PROP1-like PPR domain-containing protein n=2 Tax=Guillardia theta TaxID=55529 RepID=L1JD83_GUITC|nr:hypothetical protein GUITHDRAFT_107698 [Guillardia theta CCMP2712]EKX46493.1 hypothetical protein GUITHDRAFT_107698 [Guillardia theta CCMP2712]|eukprot:XP_005833473.1 hypothetical protein GUITHDRAFT_107698 [Guillardia theta CCMP2712]
MRFPSITMMEKEGEEIRLAVEAAEGEIDAVIASGSPPQTSHLNSWLKAAARAALCDKSNMQEVKIMLDRTRSLGVKMDETSVLRCLEVLQLDVGRGRAEMEEVFELMKQMRAMQLEFSSEICKAMLRVVAAAAGEGRGSMRQGKRVLEAFTSTGLRPDKEIYDCQLDIVSKSARSGRSCKEEAFELLAKMKEEDVRADASTFRFLMDILAWSSRHGKATLQDAERVLKEMEGSMQEPSPSFFNGMMAIVAGMASQNAATVEDARAVLERMRQQGMQPSVVTYSAMMAALAGAAKHNKASMQDGEAILLSMQEDGVEGDAITFNALLAGVVGMSNFGRTRMEDGVRVVRMMRRRGIKGDQVTLNSLLELVASAADRREATERDVQEVIELMAEDGCAPDMSSFVILRRIWSRLQRARQMSWWQHGNRTARKGEGEEEEEARVERERKAIFNFGSIFSLLAKASWEGRVKFEDVEETLAEMGAEEVGATRAVYLLCFEVAIGLASRRHGRMENGVMLLKDMKKKGVEPDAHIYMLYLNLIKVLSRHKGAGQKEAHQAFLWMLRDGVSWSTELFTLLMDVVDSRHPHLIDDRLFVKICLVANRVSDAEVHAMIWDIFTTNTNFQENEEVLIPFLIVACNHKLRKERTAQIVGCLDLVWQQRRPHDSVLLSLSSSIRPARLRSLLLSSQEPSLALDLLRELVPVQAASRTRLLHVLSSLRLPRLSLPARSMRSVRLALPRLSEVKVTRRQVSVGGVLLLFLLAKLGQPLTAAWLPGDGGGDDWLEQIHWIEG